jgi:hypothetical protein
MIRITITRADKLDLDEYVDVQVDACSSHLKKYYVSSDFINRELFEWEYAAPAGFGNASMYFLYCSSQAAEY